MKTIKKYFALHRIIISNDSYQL